MVVILGLVYFLFSKKERKPLTLYAIIDLALVYIAGYIAGKLYNNPRPFISEHITPIFSHLADNGFPSDHVIFTAALASIVFTYNKKLGVIMLVTSLVIGTSRVYAGVHHWIDIIGAFFIATIVSYLVYSLFNKLYKLK